MVSWPSTLSLAGGRLNWQSASGLTPFSDALQALAEPGPASQLPSCRWLWSSASSRPAGSCWEPLSFFLRVLRSRAASCLLKMLLLHPRSSSPPGTGFSGLQDSRLFLLPLSLLSFLLFISRVGEDLKRKKKEHSLSHLRSSVSMYFTRKPTVEFSKVRAHRLPSSEVLTAETTENK